MTYHNKVTYFDPGKLAMDKSIFKSWMNSTNSSTYASFVVQIQVLMLVLFANSSTYACFVAAQEIARYGKPFTDGDNI